MFSLTISIVAIALAATLIAVGLYYFAASTEHADKDIAAAALISQGEQILAAVDMRALDNANYMRHVADLTDNKYLSTLPTPPTGTYEQGTEKPAPEDWRVLIAGLKPPIVLSDKLDLETCLLVNEKSGVAGIEATADPTRRIQCFGVEAPFTMLLNPTTTKWETCETNPSLCSTEFCDMYPEHPSCKGPKPFCEEYPLDPLCVACPDGDCEPQPCDPAKEACELCSPEVIATALGNRPELQFVPVIADWLSYTNRFGELLSIYWTEASEWTLDYSENGLMYTDYFADFEEAKYELLNYFPVPANLTSDVPADVCIPVEPPKPPKCSITTVKKKVFNDPELTSIPNVSAWLTSAGIYWDSTWKVDTGSYINIIDDYAVFDNRLSNYGTLPTKFWEGIPDSVCKKDPPPEGCLPVERTGPESYALTEPCPVAWCKDGIADAIIIEGMGGVNDLYACPPAGGLQVIYKNVDYGTPDIYEGFVAPKTIYDGIGYVPYNTIKPQEDYYYLDVPMVFNIVNKHDKPVKFKSFANDYIGYQAWAEEDDYTFEVTTSHNCPAILNPGAECEAVLAIPKVNPNNKSNAEGVQHDDFNILLSIIVKYELEGAARSVPVAANIATTPLIKVYVANGSDPDTEISIYTEYSDVYLQLGPVGELVGYDYVIENNSSHTIKTSLADCQSIAANSECVKSHHILRQLGMEYETIAFTVNKAEYLIHAHFPGYYLEATALSPVYETFGGKHKYRAVHIKNTSLVSLTINDIDLIPNSPTYRQDHVESLYYVNFILDCVGTPVEFSHGGSPIASPPVVLPPGGGCWVFTDAAENVPELEVIGDEFAVFDTEAKFFYRSVNFLEGSLVRVSAPGLGGAEFFAH